MKNVIFGEWFGLSFGAFLIAGALVAIPAGEWMGGLLLRADAGSSSTVAASTQAARTSLAAIDAAASPTVMAASLPAPKSPIVVTAQAQDSPSSTRTVASAPATPVAAGHALTARPSSATSAPATPVTASNAGRIPAANTQTQPSASGGTLLQVSAVTSEKSARALADRLKAEGFPVFVSEPQRDAYYRVQLGPYPDRSVARKAEQAVQSEGLKVFVVH